MGVTRSGAADRRSHTLANRLVANPGDRATIEVTFGGFSARVRGGDVAIAVTGADTDPSVNGMPFGTNSIHYAHDGQVISLGAPHSGLRSYLAVRGGIDVAPVLGSRSYDVMSAIGPPPLQPGDVLPVGEHTDGLPRTRPGAGRRHRATDVLELHGGARPARRLVHRSRRRWCAPTGWSPTAATASACGWSGMPLRAPLARPATAQRGRHPRRNPGAAQRLTVILGPDHPVTGGYPVIGVVADDDIDQVAQIRPGQHVRLHWSRPRARRELVRHASAAPW